MKKTINKKTIDKLRREFEACLPKSCVKCKYRTIDGAPEPIPICGHPSLKTKYSEFIIAVHKTPIKRPRQCPIEKLKKLIDILPQM